MKTRNYFVKSVIAIALLGISGVANAAKYRGLDGHNYENPTACLKLNATCTIIFKLVKVEPGDPVLKYDSNQRTIRNGGILYYVIGKNTGGSIEKPITVCLGKNNSIKNLNEAGGCDADRIMITIPG